MILNGSIEPRSDFGNVLAGTLQDLPAIDVVLTKNLPDFLIFVVEDFAQYEKQPAPSGSAFPATPERQTKVNHPREGSLALLDPGLSRVRAATRRNMSRAPHERTAND